jgi:hypothetical protein
MEHTTTTRRPRRLATIVATALFGAVLATSATLSTLNATADLATGGKPAVRHDLNHGTASGVKPKNSHRNLAGGLKPAPNKAPR